MPPRDYDTVEKGETYGDEETPLNISDGTYNNNNHGGFPRPKLSFPLAMAGVLLVFFGAFLHKEYDEFYHKSETVYNISNPNSGQHTEKDTGIVKKSDHPSKEKARGPYKLLQVQEGDEFFNFYDFYEGADSLGSAGYNTYIGSKDAFDMGIANVTHEKMNKHQDDLTPFVYMASSPTEKGPRQSVRLEGKTTYNRGLFILDVRHMPAGCGVWPAFWLTNEENWPDYGEIDILEGINNQSKVKTAMHTSAMCSMYAHVADYNRTGVWDRATGIPDTFTGKMDFETNVPADNCWVMAAHQWQNQGCVTVSQEEGTIGTPLNEAGGGVYVLEWDPEHLYIRSWVFTYNKTMPPNLEDTIETAHLEDEDKRVRPDPQKWGLPYAYFAIGPSTGCSADHFRDMRIVFNLAFCGAVAGNRFGRDCPAETKKFQTENHNPWEACNAFIESEPDSLSEAYWKIRGVYVYERETVEEE